MPWRSGLQTLLDQPFPDSLPAYNIVLVDPSDRIWAGYVSSDPAERPSFLDAFDTTGAYVGSIDLPPGVRPLDVAGTRMLVAARGLFDVGEVRVYEIDLFEDPAS